MKKLYIKIVIFLSPFLINVLIIFLVDPYNFFNVSHIFPDADKKKCLGRTMVSTPRGNICWKTLEYERNPVDVILIGDSRMVHINNEIANQIMEEKVYNFSIPGGNVRTLNDLFWLAAKNKNLKKVFIQVAFLNSSKNVNYDLMESINKFKRDPITYLYDKDIIIDSWVNLYYHFSRDEDVVNIDVREKDVDLWKRAEYLVNNRLAVFEYSDEFTRQLKHISEYCHVHNIELCFIFLPTYYKFQDKLKEYHLSEEYNNFHKFLSSLGNTIELDTMKNFCKNRNNYRDYFHFQYSILDSVTRMTWREAKKLELLPAKLEQNNNFPK